MIQSLFTALAILMGMALYPFFTNQMLNQRQNASAVIGSVLLGVGILGAFATPAFNHDQPWHTGVQLLSFVFFACAFLGRTRGIITADKSALAPLLIGCGATVVEFFTPPGPTHLLLIVVQVLCLLAITKTYANLPTFTVVKAVYFALVYCLASGLFHLQTLPDTPLQPGMNLMMFVYVLLLISSVVHMVFQDLSRTRIKKGMGKQTKIDQDLMKLAFRGRRVLKDFRHDLRQPLSTLGILASVGKAISKDPEVTARYQHIQTAQKALKNMLEDFFDQLSNAIRYPQDDNLVPLQSVALDDVLTPLIEEYRMLAEVKDLQVRYVSTDIKVHSNKEALSKIIRNGLDNAIKYTDRGGVVVGLRRKQGRICLQIVDTGSGVESNKVAAHNKGWGHGSSIVRDLSEQILAKTTCRNRYAGGKLAGSVFEIVLPEDNEINNRGKRPAHGKEKSFEAQVMATSPEDLLEIQKLLPTQGFDKVEFSLNGAYKAYLSAFRKGMSPVYIMYAGDTCAKKQATTQLKVLASLLDFEPCCILIYNAGTESNPQIEFSKEMIKIPATPNQPAAGLGVITELFPDRHDEHTPADNHAPSSSLSQTANKVMLAS